MGGAGDLALKWKESGDEGRGGRLEAPGGQAKWGGRRLLWGSGYNGGQRGGKEKLTGEEGERSIKNLSVHNTKCQGL